MFSASQSGWALTMVQPHPTMTKMSRNGVSAPMAPVTLSTSSMPKPSVISSMSTAPIQTGRPNCWLRLAPAPANMTKPMENSVTIVAMSRIQPMTFDEIMPSTSICSLAWKNDPSWRMVTPAISMRAEERIAPHRPWVPKAEKYSMASWPDAKPAPTTVPMNAAEISKAFFSM